MILLRFWREILIAFLMLSMLAAGKYGLSKRDELILARAEFARQVEQAEAVSRAVQTRSDQTLERINATHKAVVVQAKANAVKNFQARYGNLGCGANAVRLPNNGGMPASSSGITESASVNDERSGEQVAFVRACGIDAAAVIEWQRWVRLNHLPVEDE